MAKIKFTLETWLKDKSQNVETRDGRIVHDIWRVKEPFYVNNRKAEVCALIDGEEDALVFFEGGRYLPTTQDTDNPYDLFIITPEQELTPFEDELRQVCEEAAKEALAHPERTSEDFAKTHSAKLLAIARKEIVDEWSHGLHDTQDRSGKAYNDGYQLGFERGCKALKDLPRWSKNAFTRGCAAIDISGLTVADYIRREGKLLSVSDLEKLPGFKEN